MLKEFLVGLDYNLMAEDFIKRIINKGEKMKIIISLLSAIVWVALGAILDTNYMFLSIVFVIIFALTYLGLCLATTAGEETTNNP
jgi:hypothetical protein